MPSDALPDDLDTLKAMLLAERCESERLRQIIKELQRHRFGRRAETLPEEQMLLGLEDVEQVAASGEAEQDESAPDGRAARARKRRTNRGSLPAHLPRIEVVVDVDDRTCPCCRGDLHRIGEDRSERLDMVPAQFRVLVTRRPKYACRSCEDGVRQAQAPARLIEGGLPTEATIAQVLVSKYADHLPLYRQAQIYARQGIDLDRSTLADWVGQAAWHLRPLHERLLVKLRQRSKLFADETTLPVLNPGRGRTKTGQLWAYAANDRPWGGADPPGVVHVYAPDRKAERPITHLDGFKGILQVDGYAGYRKLAERGDVQLAFCWAHMRRNFYELATPGPACITAPQPQGEPPPADEDDESLPRPVPAPALPDCHRTTVPASMRRALLQRDRTRGGLRRSPTCGSNTSRPDPLAIPRQARPAAGSPRFPVAHLRHPAAHFQTLRPNAIVRRQAMNHSR
jgi:transposase